MSSSRQILAVQIIAVFNPQFKVQFTKKPNQIATLGIRTSQMLRDIGFIRKDIIINKIPTTPPWFLARPVVNLELHCYDKSSDQSRII